MALDVGNIEATTGMSKAIYDQLKAQIEPDLKDLKPDEISAIQKSWQKMAFAVATGVVEHLKANLEIVGVTTQGDVTVNVQGNVGNATKVTFTQNNDGVGRVR